MNMLRSQYHRIGDWRHALMVAAAFAFSLTLVPVGRSNDNPIQNPAAAPPLNQNPNAKSIQWSVEAPITPWNISHSRFRDLVVARADDKLTAVVLSRVALVDSSAAKDWTLPLQHIHLCARDATNIDLCGDQLALTDRKTPIRLAVDDGYCQRENYG
jgi:hypothetical protein